MKSLKIQMMFAAALAASGCASSKSAAKLQTPAAATSETAPQASQPMEKEPSLRGNLMHESSDVETVYFAYDSSELTALARATLAGNAQWLSDHPEVRAQIAGNCDQRGTESYNLALGERRAQQVRSYYVSLGVAGDRLATISYGKDKPVCAAQTEACWTRNRRAATLVAFPEDMSRSR
jgi:peptidoglycan-associated lipoprotein